MIRFMNCIKKNKKILIVLFLVFGFFVFVDYVFFNPTELNFMIATKIYKAPANSAFTDENFYKCVVDEYNSGRSSKVAYTTSLSDSQLQQIFSLHCNDKNIVNVKGIEKLSKLGTLWVGSNQLTSLDVSNNPNLYDLNVYSNQLTSLDVSQNPLLKKLYVSNNQLTSLNVSNHLKLELLEANNNDLVTLNVSNTPALKNLKASNNQLTSFDISNHPVFEYLDVTRNKLTSLNASNNPALNDLNANNNKLTSLNVSNNPALEDLDVNYNQLTSLDVSNSPALRYLWAFSNQLTSLDVSNNPALVSLHANYNQLTALDVSHNSALKDLDVGANQLTSLKVSNMPALEVLNVFGNQLTSLDVSHNSALKRLEVSSNKLTSLNVSNHPSLESFDVGSNKLKSLDVSKMPALTWLETDRNQLTSLDVSNNSALTRLIVSENQLTSLDVSNMPALERLEVFNNKLTSLDVSHNPALVTLYVYSNQLTSFDVSNNSKLKELRAYRNQLTSLDVSHNSVLEELDVSENKLTSLDVSHNSVLEDLSVSNNQLTSLDLRNNQKLSSCSLLFNPFGYRIYVYKNGSVILEETVKVPDNLADSKPVWSSRNENVVQVSSDGVITATTTSNITNGQEVNVIGSTSRYTMTYTIVGVEITSDKYFIDNTNALIYLKSDTDINVIRNNINVLNGITIEKENNKILVKHNDEVLKSFDIVNVFSDEYNLEKDYIYQYDESKLTVTNGTKVKNTKNHTLEIKHGTIILDTYQLVNVSSEYDLSKSTIDVSADKIDKLLGKINCVNCQAKIYNGYSYLDRGDFSLGDKLRIVYGDDVLEEYSLKFHVSSIILDSNKVNLTLNDNNIHQFEVSFSPSVASDKSVTWSSSNNDVATVSSSGLVTAKGVGKAVITVVARDGGAQASCEVEVVDRELFKITYQDGDKSLEEQYFEEDAVNLNSSFKKAGYRLIGWIYDGKVYSLTNEFIMPNKDITLTAKWELIIPKIKNYQVKNNMISNISLKTSANKLDVGIDSIYTVKVYDKNNKSKTSGLVGTGDKIKIYLGSDVLVSEYVAVVKGDVTGTGTTVVSDVAKLYQFLKGKIEMDECYQEAGNVVTDEKIKVNDVAKLYQYIKGRIDSLDD